MLPCCCLAPADDALVQELTGTGHAYSISYTWKLPKCELMNGNFSYVFLNLFMFCSLCLM